MVWPTTNRLEHTQRSGVGRSAVGSRGRTSPLIRVRNIGIALVYALSGRSGFSSTGTVSACT